MTHPLQAEGSCGTCRFYVSEGSSCRRFPPVIQMLPVQAPDSDRIVQMQFNGVFPPTSPEWCCGEFVPAKSQRAQ